MHFCEKKESLAAEYLLRGKSIMQQKVFHPAQTEAPCLEPLYIILKVDLQHKKYDCVYSQDHAIYEEVEKTRSYDTFINRYVTKYVYEPDQRKVKQFLSSESLREKMPGRCMERQLFYRRVDAHLFHPYVWVKAIKHIDEREHTVMITLHQEQSVSSSVLKMKQELDKKEETITRQFWDTISLLSTVLEHNQLKEADYQDQIGYYTKQIYCQLQQEYPEYGITDEEINVIAQLAPIHDIGKIRVPIEILNKNGKLTEEEWNIIREHPLVGAEMTKWFPKGKKTEKLNQYSYEICRHHHERYDGSGYPDGLKGEEIPLCAQVVGLADAYDALVSVRPYKRKITSKEAVDMILDGACGAFSEPLLHCLQTVSAKSEWIKKAV